MTAACSAISRSSFWVNTIVGTSNPASASNAFSSAASILARERSVVSKRTLPVLMYVATSVKPAASTALMIDAFGNFRVAPRLIARRKPMYVATRPMIHTRAASSRQTSRATGLGLARLPQADADRRFHRGGEVRHRSPLRHVASGDDDHQRGESTRPHPSRRRVPGSARRR